MSLFSIYSGSIHIFVVKNNKSITVSLDLSTVKGFQTAFIRLEKAKTPSRFVVGIINNNYIEVPKVLLIE